MPSEIKHIIYDLDGVLIDGNKAILESFNKVLEVAGIDYQLEKIRGMIGVSLEDILRLLLPEHEHTKLPYYRQVYIDHFRSSDFSIVLLPDVEETLQDMQTRGIKQSIATNKATVEAERILEQLGVSKYFDLILGFDSVGTPKPAPDIIQKCMMDLGTSVDETLFIDDSVSGLTAGIKAGVVTVGITTGTHDHDELSAISPHYIIQNPRELISLI